MRIAFFVAAYPVLSETFVIRQIRGMLDLGHEVTVVTGKYHPDVHDVLADKVQLCVIRDRGDPFSDATGRVLRSATAMGRPRFARTMLRASRAALRGFTAPLVDLACTTGRHLGRYDAIIAHFGPAGVRAEFLRAAGMLEGPIATVFHGLDITQTELVRRMMPFYRHLFARTERLLPISNLWGDRLISWGAPADRIAVLRMGVDLDTSTLPAFDAPIEAPLRVLSVARLVEKKGIAYAIEGVTKAKAAIRYRIIGTGPLDAELREAARPWPETVTFLGAQPQSRVFTELKETDVFLLPSVTAANGDMEGIPVSLMEAMANGVIVLATRHSGIPELIEHGKSGFLVDERDDSEISAVLDRIARGDENLPALRRAAFDAVAVTFDNQQLDRDLERTLIEMKLA